MMDVESLKWELQRHPFFAALSNEKLETLLKLARPTNFAGRKQIFAQGDESDCLYIILSGRLKISVVSEAGKETVLAFMGEKEVLGEMGVFDGGQRSASATTLEQTNTLKLLREDILNYLEQSPQVSLQIIAALCTRLRHTNLLLEDIATLPAAPRLARALLRLAEVYGKPQDGGAVLIDAKISQSNLGAHAGLMRENVNRQLKTWENEGLITVASGLVTIADIESLRTLSEG